MPCRRTTAKNDFTNVSISHLSTRGMYKNSKMIVKNSALQAGRNKKERIKQVHHDEYVSIY